MQLERYSRQVIWPSLGEKGQKRLLTSRVLIVGMGALGSASSNLLARAGIGYLRLVDRDIVEISNLQRQTLFDEQDAKNEVPKAQAAVEKLCRINSEIKIEGIVADVNFMNVEQLMKDIDLVIDGTDNFETRFLINDACVKNGMAWVYGACLGSYGLAMTVVPTKTACLECLIDVIPAPGSVPTCDTAGIVNPIINVIAGIQVIEAMKILTGAESKRNLYVIDLWTNDFRTMQISSKKDCSCCSKRNFDSLKEGSFASVLCGENAVQILPQSSTVDLESLAPRLKAQGNKYFIKFQAGDLNIMLFPDGRAIVRGTSDINKAKAVYSQYVGL